MIIHTANYTIFPPLRLRLLLWYHKPMAAPNTQTIDVRLVFIADQLEALAYILENQRNYTKDARDHLQKEVTKLLPSLTQLLPDLTITPEAVTNTQTLRTLAQAIHHHLQPETTEEVRKEQLETAVSEPEPTSPQPATNTRLQDLLAKQKGYTNQVAQLRQLQQAITGQINQTLTRELAGVIHPDVTSQVLATNFYQIENLVWHSLTLYPHQNAAAITAKVLENIHHSQNRSLQFLVRQLKEEQVDQLHTAVTSSLDGHPNAKKLIISSDGQTNQLLDTLKEVSPEDTTALVADQLVKAGLNPETAASAAPQLTRLAQTLAATNHPVNPNPDSPITSPLAASLTNPDITNQLHLPNSVTTLIRENSEVQETLKTTLNQQSHYTAAFIIAPIVAAAHPEALTPTTATLKPAEISTFLNQQDTSRESFTNFISTLAQTSQHPQIQTELNHQYQEEHRPQPLLEKIDTLQQLQNIIGHPAPSTTGPQSLSGRIIHSAQNRLGYLPTPKIPTPSPLTFRQRLIAFLKNPFGSIANFFQTRLANIGSFLNNILSGSRFLQPFGKGVSTLLLNGLRLGGNGLRGLASLGGRGLASLAGTSLGTAAAGTAAVSLASIASIAAIALGIILALFLSYQLFVAFWEPLNSGGGPGVSLTCDPTTDPTCAIAFCDTTDPTRNCGWPTPCGCVTYGPFSSFSHDTLNAIDIGRLSGQCGDGHTDVTATHNGTIIEVVNSFGENVFVSKSYGNVVRLQGVDANGNAYETLYAHLWVIAPYNEGGKPNGPSTGRILQAGDFIEKGHPIGKTDNNGFSYGEHLHYEYRGGDSINTIIPEKVPKGCETVAGCGNVCW